MTQLPTIELRTKIITGWLCVDSDWYVSVWLGARAGIGLNDADAPTWHDLYTPSRAGHGRIARWLERDGEETWPMDDFCGKWTAKPTDLPSPGECKRVRLKVPA